MLRNDAVIALIIVGALTFYEGLQLPSKEEMEGSAAVVVGEVNAKDAKEGSGVVEHDPGLETQRSPRMYGAENAKDTGRVVYRVRDEKE